MGNYANAIALVFLGVCVYISASAIADSLTEQVEVPSPTPVNVDVRERAAYKYDIISPSENLLIMVDKEEGKLWRKNLEEGSDWELIETPTSETTRRVW